VLVNNCGVKYTTDLNERWTSVNSIDINSITSGEIQLTK